MQKKMQRKIKKKNKKLLIQFKIKSIEIRMQFMKMISIDSDS